MKNLKKILTVLNRCGNIISEREKQKERRGCGRGQVYGMRRNYIELNVKGILDVKTKKDITKIRTLLSESNLHHFGTCKRAYDEAIESDEYDFKILKRYLNWSFRSIEFFGHDKLSGGYLDETIIDYNEIHRKMGKIIEANSVDKFIIVSEDEMRSVYNIMSKHYGANAFTDAVDKADSKHMGYNLDDMSDTLNAVMLWDEDAKAYSKEQYNDIDAECFEELRGVL